MANWNGGELAICSAKSILDQDVRPTLWVVDNGSKDGSADRIADLDPGGRVHIIRNPGNYGYALANNQALARTPDAEYYLLINNDVILPDLGGLGRVIARMATDSSIHGACGRYEFPDGRFQRFYNRLPRPFDLMFHYGILKNAYFLLSRRQMGYFLAVDLDYTREQWIEQPAFSCVLLTTTGLRRVGLFDERFPVFFNDVDFCWRWAKAQLHWHYFPDWRVIHYKSNTTGAIGPQQRAEIAGSAVRFARKHFRPLTAFLVRTAITAQCGYRKYLRGDFPESAAGVWRGDLPFTASRLDLPSPGPARGRA